MRGLFLAILLAGCTSPSASPVPPQPQPSSATHTSTWQEDIKAIEEGVDKLIQERNELREEVKQLKAKKTPRERCMDDLGFKDQTNSLYVCTPTEDFMIIPLSGRYLLARGLGCGETFEDSFLLFKTRKDVNDYIDATLCAQKEQK